ncbi:MAG: carbon starvation protein A [Planctomycetes bacterium]|nr:carbon starvation protein A [Planctomycetota bacterium]MCP4772184.1 carbon starvation protein A [Planctomycetota bacterium]MCP4861240.1 carbon starvation protein A [Planctomycetota bacterium]
MSAAVVTFLALIVYVVGYRYYSRWLAQKVFVLDANAVTPAHELEDGIDFVPTRPLVLFGHHYASIAGLAPMLGPAVAVFWGWLPALVWVVCGSLLVGCVHDFAALVLSARHRGESIGSLCESILGPKAKALFLLLILFGVALAMGVFVYIISLLFSWNDDFNPAALAESTTSFPEVVMPSAGLMIVAMVCGWLLYVKKKPLLPVTIGGFSALLGLIGLGYMFPTLGFERASWPQQNTWIWILMTYAYAASVLPVWLLLQARDFLNSLLLVMGLLLMYSGFFIQAPTFDAPAFNPNPEGAPPILPFVFITIACGAASGFHSLVASGTTARQLDKEHHARPIGYGGMIAESLLGLIAVLACTTTFSSGSAWAKLYVNWGAVSATLGAKLGVFIRGSASFIHQLGVPMELATTLVAMVVVSFALTTLDSATRLLRFNIEEIGSSIAKVPALSPIGRLLTNRFLATGGACAVICFFAFFEIDGKPAGLTLWTLFGGTNQLIAGLALLTATVYIKKKGRNYWPLAIPAVFMIAITMFALISKLIDFMNSDQTLLLGLTFALVFIGVGVGITALLALRGGARD